MKSFLLLFGAILAVLLLGWLNLRATARRAGKGASRRGSYQGKPQLGQEATDMAAFNAAMSRNAPPGKAPQELQGLGRGIGSHVAPVKDDETYAARYHAAFGEPEKRQ